MSCSRLRNARYCITINTACTILVSFSCLIKTPTSTVLKSTIDILRIFYPSKYNIHSNGTLNADLYILLISYIVELGWDVATPYKGMHLVRPVCLSAAALLIQTIQQYSTYNTVQSCLTTTTTTNNNNNNSNNNNNNKKKKKKKKLMGPSQCVALLVLLGDCCYRW